MNLLLFAFWFFLPAGVANVTPIIASRMPGLANLETALDFGKTWAGRPIFGKNKTWRGLITGTAMGSITAIVLYPLLFRWYPEYNEYNTQIVLVGALLGAGALLGDAIESFFKRRIGIAPGNAWFPFDQIDYIIGASILSAFVVQLPLHYYVIILFVWFGMHLLFSYLGFLLKLKDKPI